MSKPARNISGPVFTMRSLLVAFSPRAVFVSVVIVALIAVTIVVVPLWITTLPAVDIVESVPTNGSTPLVGRTPVPGTKASLSMQPAGHFRTALGVVRVAIRAIVVIVPRVAGAGRCCHCQKQSTGCYQQSHYFHRPVLRFSTVRPQSSAGTMNGRLTQVTVSIVFFMNRI